jgi:hypothetical protein
MCVCLSLTISSKYVRGVKGCQGRYTQLYSTLLISTLLYPTLLYLTLLNSCQFYSAIRYYILQIIYCSNMAKIKHILFWHVWVFLKCGFLTYVKIFGYNFYPISRYNFRILHNLHGMKKWHVLYHFSCLK